jgi:hypothetical protein
MMMNIKKYTHICLIIFLFLASCVNKTAPTESNSNSSLLVSKVLTNAQWIADLEELYTHLKKDHRDIYHRTKSADFEELFIQIKNDIPSLSDQEIIVQFARFVALTNDGHTRLTLPLQEGIGLSQAHSKTPLPSDSILVFRHLPIEFYWFDDGVYIIRATEQYQNLIGQKVLKINETPIEEALKNVRKIAHYDNESGYKLIAPSRLAILEVLQALNIVTDNDIVNITVGIGDTTEKILIDPLERFSKTAFLNKNLKSQDDTPTLSRQKNDVYYWYQYIEDKKVIYLQINQMNDAKSNPDLIKFIGNLNKFIQKNDVHHIVLDLRNNFGGNNQYSLPIANLIIKNPKLNKIGNFYTIIGRKTFSAAQFLVNDLGKWTNVIFVGEPTGASPSHYGDSKKVQLSNSNLTVRISSIYWRDWTSEENRKTTTPDIPIDNNASDYFQNTDMTLNACLNFKTSNKLVDTYISLYETGGIETAERLYYRIALDWNMTTNDVSSVENKLVEWMSEKK